MRSDERIGSVVDFEEDFVHCKHLTAPMEPPERPEIEEHNFITNVKESEAAEEAVDRVKQILNEKCALLTPPEKMKQSPHLTDGQWFDWIISCFCFKI